MLVRVIDYIKKVVSPISEVLVHIAMAVIVLVTLVVVADVSLRRLFNSPIHGSNDLATLGFSIIVFLPLAWCALQNGHIELDLITRKLPKMAQQSLEVIMTFLGVIILVLVTWQILEQGIKLQAGNAESAILGIPLPPFIYSAFVGMAILTLAFFIRLLNGINNLRGEQ